MNAPAKLRSAITGVKVDVQRRGDLGKVAVALEWYDAAGAYHYENYYGAFAEHFETDLHAVTLQGEEARQAYLIGRIRELTRLPG